MNLKQTANKLKLSVGKHSPSILTTVGILGLGTTAYLAYRSRNKVEKVVLDIEEARDNDLEINKMEVVRGMVDALWLPISVGVASTACIVLAQNIQNKRIRTLAGALAAQQAQNVYFKKKYKDTYGEEKYQKFMTPSEEVETGEVDKKGKAVVKEVKKEVDETIGQWYDESSEYVNDDHAYNVQMIESVTERLQNRLFQRGSLLLNEVREELGFERIRAGALLGWTTADSFDIEKVVTTLGDETAGELKEQIYVTWTAPRYIYDDVEFNGQYSVY